MATIDERVQALEDKLNILEDILFSLGRALKLGEAPVEDNWVGRPGSPLDPKTLDDVLFTIGSYLADNTLTELVDLGRGTNCPPICQNVEGGIMLNALKAQEVKKKSPPSRRRRRS